MKCVYKINLFRCKVHEQGIITKKITVAALVTTIQYNTNGMAAPLNPFINYDCVHEQFGMLKYELKSHYSLRKLGNLILNEIPMNSTQISNSFVVFNLHRNLISILTNTNVNSTRFV